MDVFLVSAGLVALAEIGDKTMLLAVLLAAKFRAPGPILAGIFAATLANHALAAAVGSAAGHLLDGPWMRWVLGLSFLAFAAWSLVPDKIEEGEAAPRALGSVFLTTTMAFFVVEMGDKTQVATAALAARFADVAVVAAGTTLGMMAANTPAVLFGEKIAAHAPMGLVRLLAALCFAALGVWTLLAG